MNVKIQADEPTLHVLPGDTEGQARRSQVSVRTGTAAGRNFVIMASRAASGTCYAMLEQELEPTRYQQHPGGDCTADSFDPTGGWTSQWS
jgi:hypothetical protein